ncbi:hypothetical protein EBH_0080790 [Eimeria brunetti]|uniref:Uncharacterized protein n=1 Tax=Eimeria brunetti TaxID=51314 RepID=U6LJA9_9EIME|nr:hypothetical protein EBH_0080790 [Eimeria brunetti]
MLPAATFDAAATYPNFWVPEQTSAAAPPDNGVPYLPAIHEPLEDVLQEQVLPVPRRAASPPIRPALGIVLLGGLSTALFLLLRCVQRFASSQKAAGGANKSGPADAEGEPGECKKLKELLANDGGDNGAMGEGAFGGQPPIEEPTQMNALEMPQEDEYSEVDDSLNTPPKENPPERDYTIPKRFSDYPPADPPVTLGKQEVQDRIYDMQEVLDFLYTGKRDDTEEGTGGYSLAYLVKRAYRWRQTNKNAKFGPDVTEEQIKKFERLMNDAEKLVLDLCSVGSRYAKKT